MIKIRKDDINTAFIILSNNKNNHFLIELLEFYIIRYISKLFDNEILIQALNKCMEIIERNKIDADSLLKSYNLLQSK